MFTEFTNRLKPSQRTPVSVDGWKFTLQGMPVDDSQEALAALARKQSGPIRMVKLWQDGEIVRKDEANMSPSHAAFLILYNFGRVE